MSTCAEIMAKLNSIESQLSNIKLGEDVVNKIDNINTTLNDAINGFNQFQDEFGSFLGQQFQLLTSNQIKIADALSKVGENQIHSAENMVNLSNGIKNLGLLEKANNDSIKSLAMSNGSLSSDVLQQIANCEAILKALNNAILK